MKTLKKGNTINKTDLGENSIELFTGDDVISSYDLNRPIKNIFDNQVEEKIFRETLLKGVYGNQVGIFKNVLEEFDSDSTKVFATYNGETYFRVPSGVLVDKLSSDYIQDDFYSYGFVNKPNLGLMERQLASLINIDLTEDGNELSIEYDSKNKSYTINTSIDYVTGIQKTSLPAPASCAKELLSFYGVVSSASGLKITTYLDEDSYQTANLPASTTAEDACTAVFNSLNVADVTEKFTLEKVTDTSISITYKTIGSVGNSINCSITKSNDIDSLIVSGPTGYLSGGMDYKPITNVFEVFDAFRTAYSGYNISSKGLEYKLNLEPLFNITNITINTPYCLYFNRGQEKNFVNLSSTVSSCTDASGNFGLSITTPPENSFVIGTVIKDSYNNLSYKRNTLIALLSEDTIYPKNINANKIEAEDFISTGSFGVAQTNFVNKMAVTARTMGYTKIATFDPRQSFGIITVSVISEGPHGKNGSFSIEINSGEENRPSITVKGMVYSNTVDYIKVEVHNNNNMGNIWLHHGTFLHSLEMNLANSLNVTLFGEDQVDPIPEIPTLFVFERYLASEDNANTTDSYQFNITNNEINSINPITSLKAQSDKNLLKVGNTEILQSVSYKIGETNKTAEVKLAGAVPIPLFTLKGANVEISNFDANDSTNNRYIKIYTGPGEPLENTEQDDPETDGPSIMLDKNTVDISGDNVHVWGNKFTVHSEHINFDSANISGKLFVADSTDANFEGTDYSTRINGGLYTGGNIIANTTIEAKGNIKGSTINSLTVRQESVGFKISGGSSTRKTGTFMSNFTVGTADKLGDITISSNNGTARTIVLGGDLTVSSGKFTLSGNASGTILNIANDSLKFLPSLSKTGALLYTSTANTVESLTAVAPGSVLLSGTAAPSWGKVPLTTHVNGILPLANGGTGSQGSTTNRAIPYISGGKFHYTGAGTNNSLLGINSSGAVEWISNNDLTVSKADKLSSNKTLSFTGGATGSVTTNFEASLIQCTLTVKGDSHKHVVGDLTSVCKDLGNAPISKTSWAYSAADGAYIYNVSKTVAAKSFVIGTILTNYHIVGRVMLPKIVVELNNIRIFARTKPADDFTMNFVSMAMQ